MPSTVRDHARTILESPDLEAKLRPFPTGAADDEPGPALRIEAPARAPSLQIRPGREVIVPPLAGMPDPAQRARILHALANHELQAAELFAWALLAFPDAPRPFRRGLIAICEDEQRHCQLYLDRLAPLGGHFGDHGLTGHFWNKLGGLTSPLAFACTMGLTFENANLDFVGEYAAAARAAGDHATAAALEQVHADEIGHVRFAWTWLEKLRPPELTPWDAYLASVTWPLGPTRARGKTFDRASRIRAGLPADIIAAFEAAAPTRPSGKPR